MKLMILFILLLWTVPQNTWASACERLPVRSLKLMGLSGQETQNLCLKNKDSLLASEKALIERVEIIHQKVFSLFNTSLDSKLIEPYSLEINESLFGWLPSLASKNGLLITVYPNTAFDINEAVFVHELAHLISYSLSPELPGKIRSLHRNKLFSETFADFMALAITSHTISPKVVPNCLDRLRYIGTHQTYSMRSDYFQNFTEKRILKCCETLLGSKEAPRFENELCQEVVSWGFTPSQERDDHQIGIPLLSFFKAFSAKTGMSMNEIFKRFFVNSYSKKNDHDLRSVLKEFELNLSGKDLSVFKKLYQKHKIEMGLSFFY